MSLFWAWRIPPKTPFMRRFSLGNKTARFQVPLAFGNLLKRRIFAPWPESNILKYRPINPTTYLLLKFSHLVLKAVLAAKREGKPGLICVNCVSSYPRLLYVHHEFEILRWVNVYSQLTD